MPTRPSSGPGVVVALSTGAKTKGNVGEEPSGPLTIRAVPLPARLMTLVLTGVPAITWNVMLATAPPGILVIGSPLARISMRPGVPVEAPKPLTQPESTPGAVRTAPGVTSPWETVNLLG